MSWQTLARDSPIRWSDDQQNTADYHWMGIPEDREQCAACSRLPAVVCYRLITMVMIILLINYGVSDSVFYETL